MISRIGLASAFLLILAVVSILRVAAAAPALSPSLRVDSVYGDWRVPVDFDLYDKGRYRFQIGYSYLQGDAFDILAGSESLSDEAIFLDRTDVARRLFMASLTSKPGHAATWSALAWARLAGDDLAGTLTALRTSWVVAPNNLSEAPGRLALAAALSESPTNDWPRNQVDIDSVKRDILTLRTYDPAYFQLIADDFPILSDIAEKP